MRPRVRLFVALVSTTLLAYIALGSLLGRVMGDSTYGQLAVFNEVIRLVLEAYVEPVNLERAMGGARLGLTDALDGDSAYLDDQEFKLYQQPAPKADADVGMEVTRRFSFLMVVATRKGSPAEKAGVRAGDIVKSIDGRHSRSLPAAVGRRLLHGAPGSVVKVTLLRASTDPIELSLVRERSHPAAVEARVIEPGAGYVKVPEVTARSADDVKGELESLKKQGARRLVLDLRGAGLGAPQDGVKVAELFLKGGVVGKIASARTPEQVLTADPGRAAWDLPMTILVDHGTAGPAEIVAAALRDAGRSSLVGQHTFGRAANQKAVSLAEGGIVITVSRYVAPKGDQIHGKGLAPTVPVEPADDEDREAGRDPILEKALELLRSDKAEVKKAA